MGSDKKGSAIIPTLLTGAAVYFGLTQDSSKLGDITKQALSRVIDDQAPSGKRNKNRSRKFNKTKSNKHQSKA